MKITKLIFQVEIQFQSPETRQMVSQEHFRQSLEHYAQGVAEGHTEGKIPSVSVVSVALVSECSCGLCPECAAKSQEGK